MTNAPLAHTRHIHAVIRQGGRFLMLYSEAYSYYKFPHDTADAAETPEQALCRIVPVQGSGECTKEPANHRFTPEYVSRGQALLYGNRL